MQPFQQPFTSMISCTKFLGEKASFFVLHLPDKHYSITLIVFLFFCYSARLVSTQITPAAASAAYIPLPYDNFSFKDLRCSDTMGI